LSATENNKRKRRILVVEPDPELCSLLCEFLKAQRFQVEDALSGDEVIEKVSQFTPDLVLLSRELPMGNGQLGPDGIRVLKVIKKSRDSHRIPVILTSAEVSEQDFERYRKLKFSADDYIKKPFEDTEILRRIENLVGFDISDHVSDIRAAIDDVMDDSFTSVFDADAEELGLSSSKAARNEVARLLEQVGEELDRQDQDMTSDEQPERPPEEAPPEAKAGTESEQRIERMNLELAETRRQLEKVQKQLVGERKRSREIKREWKQRLQEIAARLQEKQELEERMRVEFEKMRERFVDVELDHTMELERLHGEKRRLEEEIMILKSRDMNGPYSKQELAEDLEKVTKAIKKITKKLDQE